MKLHVILKTTARDEAPVTEHAYFGLRILDFGLDERARSARANF